MQFLVYCLVQQAENTKIISKGAKIIYNRPNLQN